MTTLSSQNLFFISKSRLDFRSAVIGTLTLAFIQVKFTGDYYDFAIIPLFRDHGQMSKKPNFSFDRDSEIIN